MPDDHPRGYYYHEEEEMSKPTWNVKIVHNATLDGTENMWGVSVRKSDDALYKLERIFTEKADAIAYKNEIEALNNAIVLAKGQ